MWNINIQSILLAVFGLIKTNYSTSNFSSVYLFEKLQKYWATKKEKIDFIQD